MKKKIEFDLNDYEFKIVKMDVFNNDDKENISEYYLLVDGNNFIHDYKVRFKQVYLTRYTTPSHEKSKPAQLEHREMFLKQLNIKNSFEEQKTKEYILINDKVVIENLNKWSFEYRWNDVQFQQLEYLVRGSNSSGQGNGRGYFKIIYKKYEKVPFGFFLQELNIYNKIKTKYSNVSYERIWEKFNSFDDLDNESISFDYWLDTDKKIRDLFKHFFIKPHNWKDIKEQFKEKFKHLINEYEKIDNIVSQYRSEYIKNINKKYGNRDEILESFFNTKSTRIEYAHIKPVWYIKREYQETKNEKVLLEIKDTNNFLPLPASIHVLYDSYYIYWDENGLLKTIKNVEDDDIKSFLNINKKIVINIKKFLRDYQKVLAYKNNIN